MSSSPTQKFHEAFNEEGRPLGRLIPFSIIEKGSPDQQTLASSVAFLETQALSFDEVLRGFRDNKTLLKNLRVSRKCEKHLPLLAFYLKQTKVTFELVHGVSLLPHTVKNSVIADPHWAACVQYCGEWFLLNPAASEPEAFHLPGWEMDQWIFFKSDDGNFQYCFSQADHEIIDFEMSFFASNWIFHSTHEKTLESILSVFKIFSEKPADEPSVFEQLALFSWHISPKHGARPSLEATNFTQELFDAVKSIPSKGKAEKTLKSLGAELGKKEHGTVDLFPKVFYAVLQCYHKCNSAKQ